MAFEPVVVEFTPPKTPGGGLWSKLPKLGPRGTKLLIAAAAGVMLISMLIFTVFTIQSNNADFSKKHGLDILSPQTSGTQKSDAALPGGGIAVGIGGTTGKNAPAIKLTAEPASVTQGGKATLKWTVTNSPSSCVASDDWSGNKSTSGGTETTATLTKIQNYLFTLTCKTATGTGFMTVAVSVIAPTVSSAGATSTATTGVPSVKIAATPNLMYAGDSSAITWEASNNPSSCSASGDWSGTKAGSGTASTGALTTARTYTYTITCTNSKGTSAPASAQLTVQALPAGIPGVFVDSSATKIKPGQSVTISWHTENSPEKCVASDNWSGNKSTAGGSQTFSGLAEGTYTYTLTCSTGTDSRSDAAVVQVIPDPPSVSLTVTPSSITSGQSSTITWSSTNSPTSCTASGTGANWSGSKSAVSGAHTQSTGTMTTGNYTYNLSCTNSGGTGYANNVPLTVTNVPAPVVTISASPIAITTGSSSNITWSVTNSPTSCTASGSWSGTKASSGTTSTTALNTAGTYTYTLTCSNAGGSDTGSTSVSVTSGGGATNPPVVSISASPTTIGTGSSTTLTWSATNSPTSCTASGSWSGSKSASGSGSGGVVSTAGTYTYTLSCSNSAGSGSKSVSITAVAIPTVSVSVSPATISAGSSTTVSWTIGNSPTSCTAGGTGWSGSKSTTSSSQSVTLAGAGSYTFTMSCSNAGGTGTSNTATVTVNAAVYCSGRTPCYSTADLNSHATYNSSTKTGECWAYVTSTSDATNKSVYNIATFNSGWHQSSTPKTNLLPSSTAVTAFCGAKDLKNYLAGTSVSGVGSHNHQTNTKQNNNATLNTYRQGYYDSTKP